MKLKKIIIILSLSFINQFGFAQLKQDNNDCRDILQKFVADMAKISSPDEHKIYLMKYRVETFNKAKSGNQNSNMSGQVLLSGNKSFFESSLMSSYVDDKNGFLILHGQRKIIWGPGGKNANGNENFKMLSAVQDSLVRLSHIGVCKNVTRNDNRKMKLIELIPGEKIERSFKVTRLEVLFDLTKNAVYSVTIFYNEKSELDRMTVTYDDLNFDYNGTLFSNAFSKVLNSNGTLKPGYKGYELIDNRAQN